MARNIRTITGVVLLVLVQWSFSSAQANEAQDRAAIATAAEALDRAFERQDKDAAAKLLTMEHLAVTPYYKGPQNVADQLRTLSELKYQQTILGEGVPIIMLCDEAAMRIYAAELRGSFKDQKLPPLVYVSEIWVKREGAWRESFYQATAFRP
jgi:hypothetical protein